MLKLNVINQLYASDGDVNKEKAEALRIFRNICQVVFKSYMAESAVNAKLHVIVHIKTVTLTARKPQNDIFIIWKEDLSKQNTNNFNFISVAPSADILHWYIANSGTLVTNHYSRSQVKRYKKNKTLKPPSVITRRVSTLFVSSSGAFTY